MEWFQPAGLVVEVSQIVVHEADEPDVVAGLLDADGLSVEDGTEIDLALMEANTAACGDDQRLRGDDGNMRT